MYVWSGILRSFTNVCKRKTANIKLNYRPLVPNEVNVLSHRSFLLACTQIL